MGTERVLSTDERLNGESLLREIMHSSKVDPFDNPFLFTRTGLLSKFLVMNELYKKILDIPGNIVEVGSWFGQSSIIFENLRAIHENFNNTRRIISLDTFSGYVENSGLDIKEEEINKYNTGSDWLNYLESIQNSHKLITKSSTNFINIKGDVRDTLPEILKKLNEPVSMIYYDIATLDTLDNTFNAILPFIGRGSIFVFDDYGPQYRGVSDFLTSNRILQNYTIKHCEYYKSKLYLTFE